MNDCSPGIIWSVMPIELVLEGLAPAYPARAEMVLSGRLVEVEHGSDGMATVVRLLSANPRDYLDPRFQPGVRFYPGSEG